MEPLPLTRFWHHRICEAIILVSGLVLALYFWAFFAEIEVVSGALLVSDAAAIAAGVAFVAAFVSYLFSPRKYIFHTSLVGFYVLIVMVGLLVSDTGFLSSPFIGLYLLLGVFAPIFGLYGVAAIVAGGAVYLGMQWSEGLLTWGDVATTLIVVALPLGVGFLAWTNRGKQAESAEDRSYHELASELSTLAGQSEVVIAAIADGVVSLNEKGEIQLINPAAQHMIGWGKSDALNLSYQSVLKFVDNHDQAITEANDPIRQALMNNKETVSDSLFLTTEDLGKKFQVALTASPVGGSSNSGVIVVFRDITSERASEREQAEFISTASHEMRTPVASIEGYLGLALNPATAQIDEKAREYIGKAQESAQHLGRLFQDLLDVSRADDGRLTNNPGIIDVVPFVHDIVQGQLPKATAKSLTIDYKPTPDLYPADNHEGDKTISPVFYVNVDNDHLREVVGNLVENAIKYTKQGSIAVDVTGDDKFVTISIQDSGIGIPKEDIPHLFQKFYRVDNSDTREIGGTGLGLYLCRRLTEAMGGKLWVESVYKEGSTFFVKLPRTNHDDARRKIESAGETPITSAPPQVAQPAAAPASQPTTPPTPQPITTPQPQPVQQTSQPPSVTRPTIEAMSPVPRSVTPAPTTRPSNPAQPRSNTPLSQIEANPRNYVSTQQPANPPNPPQQ